MKNNLIIIVTTILTVFSCSHSYANVETEKANLITEKYSSANNEVIIGTSFKSNFQGNIIVQSISFNNSEQDYIIFKVETENESINLQGLSFIDDKAFKTISDNFFVHDDDLVKLSFKSDKKDDSATNSLYTEKSGLTATTEQILITYYNENLAFFCWTSETPSVTEVKQFNNLDLSNIWEGNDIHSCFPSEDIKSNNAIIRIGNENNLNSWQIDHELKDNDEINDNTLSDEFIFLLNNQNAEDMEQSDIYISEIFPAPSQKQHSEWVEIVNENEKAVDLSNWIIDDSEDGSKPQRLTQIIIPPMGIIVLDLSDLKINLNNSGDFIRLFDPQGKLIDIAEFPKVEKDKSYSLIKVENEKIWQWTNPPSPGFKNPVIISIEGKIIKDTNFQNEYYFVIEDNNHKPFIVYFSEDTIKAPLAKELFRENSFGKFRGENQLLGENKDIQALILYDFDLQIPNSLANFNWYWFYIIVTLLAIIGFYIYKNKNKWAVKELDTY